MHKKSEVSIESQIAAEIKQFMTHNKNKFNRDDNAALDGLRKRIISTNPNEKKLSWEWKINNAKENLHGLIKNSVITQFLDGLIDNYKKLQNMPKPVEVQVEPLSNKEVLEVNSNINHCEDAKRNISNYIKDLEAERKSTCFFSPLARYKLNKMKELENSIKGMSDYGQIKQKVRETQLTYKFLTFSMHTARAKTLVDNILSDHPEDGTNVRKHGPRG